MNTHEFLESKGIKSIKETFSAYQIEQWLKEYASQQPSLKWIDIFIVECYFWKDNWINEEPSQRYIGTKKQCEEYLKKEAEENKKYNPKLNSWDELVYDTDERRHYMIKIVPIEPLPNSESSPIPKQELGEYQLCPKCLAEGKIPTTQSTSVYKICDVCNGDKIIPRPLLTKQDEDELKKESKQFATLVGRINELENCIRGFLKEPYGCRFCDSGKLRVPNNPKKDHDEDCPYFVAEKLLNNK